MGVYVECDVCKRLASARWNDTKKGFDLPYLWPFIIDSKTKELVVVVCSEFCRIIFEKRGAG